MKKSRFVFGDDFQQIAHNAFEIVYTLVSGGFVHALGRNAGKQFPHAVNGFFFQLCVDNFLHWRDFFDVGSRLVRGNYFDYGDVTAFEPSDCSLVQLRVFARNKHEIARSCRIIN
jgi:hypothetical protein